MNRREFQRDMRDNKTTTTNQTSTYSESSSWERARQGKELRIKGGDGSAYYVF